jgi:toxin-antitoxin system PIN domain toxin
VIVVDVNLLIYAHCEQAVEHDRARRWLEGVVGGPEAVGLPWAVMQAFVRISSDARALRPPMAAATALEIVAGWFAAGNVMPLLPSERHWATFARMVIEGQCSGPLVSDAHLAALVIEHGAHLYTTDRDFSRFPGLRWSNPIA